jgi:hypothetical protein
MQTQQHYTVIETVLATAGAAAVVYFCFTASGRQQLRRLEQWVDEGTSESSRMLDTVERVAMIAAAIGGVIGLVSKAEGDRPMGRSAAIENLLALPSALQAAPRHAAGR